LRALTGVSEGTMTRLKVQKTEPLRLEYEDIFAALHNDALPSVTGEDGLAVLKAAIQISSMAYQEDHGVQAAKVAVEAGVEV